MAGHYQMGLDELRDKTSSMQEQPDWLYLTIFSFVQFDIYKIFYFMYLEFFLIIK